MKLSQIKKDEIAGNILEIYDKPFAALEKERDKVVIDNYPLWVQQYQEYIDKLPTELFNLSDKLKVEIKATNPLSTDTYWTAYNDTKVPVLSKNSGYYAEAIAIELDPSLQDTVNDLIKRNDELTAEKSNLRTFIYECLDVVNTTKQLRELWTEYPALAKHIPAEPTRKKKTVQESLNLESTLDINTINRRLTENLLGS